MRQKKQLTSFGPMAMENFG